jgi:hypothetical protein
MTLINCFICAAINPNLSNVENARAIGVNEATIRRHKAHMVKTDVDEHFQIPNSIITSRGRTTRLPDGSYEKVTYQPNRLALLEAMSYDDLERAIEEYKPNPAPRHRSNTHAEVLDAADLQIGKAMEAGGGTPETVACVMSGFHKFADWCAESQPAAIVLNEGGDVIENIWNTGAQKATNDLDVPAQIRTARRLLLEGIKMLAPLAPVLYYVSGPSNHGAHRDNFKSQAGSVDADFGLEISYQLEDICSESPYLQHVKFVRPEPLWETSELEVGNTKLAFTHGHLSNSIKSHGDWWARVDHGRMPGWDADILVTNHYHTMQVQQSGNGRWIISGASPDPGSGWFSRKTGETASRGMTAFTVSDGMWHNLRMV